MALKQFDKTYPNEGYSCPHQSLELVMPLLFDRRNPDDKCPRPKNWFDRSEGIELDQDSWYFWIMVEDGIPFHTVMIRGTSGMPGNQSYLIEWANDHARLRESPMSQKQYEYRIHYLALETRKGNEEQLVEALNEFGKDGWRLKRPYGEMSLRSTTCGDERSRTLGNDAKTGDNPEESGVQAILQRHETAGTTDSTEYQSARMEFYHRHVIRLDPMREHVARTFAKLERNPQVYHTMNGPSEFHVVGNLKDWDIVSRLPEIKVSTLVTSGRHDEATPLIAETVHRGIRDSEWVIFENSSHLAHVEEADRYITVLDGFLCRHDEN